MAEAFKRNPNTKCIVCGKDIYRRPSEILVSKGRRFCSTVCYGISNRREKPCIICGAQILAHYKKKTCNRACANKLRAGIQYKGSRPRDKVKFFRAIRARLTADRGYRCQRCGYDKFEILQIHHIDRNRENNNLDNLELICPNCHSEEHLRMRNVVKLGKLGEVA